MSSSYQAQILEYGILKNGLCCGGHTGQKLLYLPHRSGPSLQGSFLTFSRSPPLVLQYVYADCPLQRNQFYQLFLKVKLMFQQAVLYNLMNL
ncbi:MAG: hypothetical protein QXO71_10115 [Candidatus Jordarchaeaceae archaeon]